MDDIEFLSFETEEEIIKNLQYLDYPAVSLHRNGGNSTSFYFNRLAAKFLLGPKIAITKGKLRGDMYLCFRNTKSDEGYAPGKKSSTSYSISANGALNALGLLCTKFTFRNRKCFKIDNGVAIKVYE